MSVRKSSYDVISARNPRIERLIRRCLQKIPEYNGNVRGRSFGPQWDLPIAFTTGFSAGRFLGGGIYASESLLADLDDEQLFFVVSHEIVHLMENHVAKDTLVKSSKLILKAVFASGYGISASQIDMLWGGIRNLIHLFEPNRGIEGEFLAEHELLADHLAVTSLGADCEAALRTLEYVKRFNSRGVSHWTRDGCFAFPALMVSERITALRNVCFPSEAIERTVTK